MGRSVVQPAYAKVNLNLLVGPPIPAGQPKAGYHPIVSLMDLIDLHDDVRVEVRGAGEASRYSISWAEDAPRPSPIDWPVDKDLAVRAHRLLEAHAGRPLPIDLAVRKRIPVGGGLGGGSSDAAATLVAVSKAHGLVVTAEELMELGAGLGSDVPFLVSALSGRGTPALVTRLGERVRPMPELRTGENVLLLVPPFGCSTSAVYAALDVGRSAFPAADSLEIFEGTVRGAESDDDFGMLMQNDLAQPASTLEHRLLELADLGRDLLGRKPVLTGSGSTLVCTGDLPTLERAREEFASVCRHRAKVDPTRSGWMGNVKMVLARFV